MATNEMTVEGKELLSSLTIKIRWPRGFWFRLRIAAALLWLVDWVSPVGIDPEIVHGEDQDD